MNEGLDLLPLGAHPEPALANRNMHRDRPGCACLDEVMA